MGIRVTHSTGDLADDLRAIRAKAPVELRGVVRDGIRAGNTIAKANAERTSGEHGVHYPKAFTTEMHSRFAMFGTVIYSGEYGPDISRPQGGMSFEFGSRNQPPHLDLAKSADIIGGSTAREVRDVLDRLFW